MNSHKRNYQIIFYKTSTDREVILEFIEKLEDILKARVRNALRLLEENGLELMQAQIVKKIYNHPSLYELRIIGDNQIRLLFFIYNNMYFLIVHIFKKKQQKL